MILALDPGNEKSALIGWNGNNWVYSLYDENEKVMAFLLDLESDGYPLVIEKVASYGMPVGESIFETVFWSGRFAEAYGIKNVSRVPRIEVKMHLCHNSRAKDGNIRQALIDRFGVPGTKKAPGRLYGITGDLWAALALAVTAWDQSR